MYNTKQYNIKLGLYFIRQNLQHTPPPSKWQGFLFMHNDIKFKTFSMKMITSFSGSRSEDLTQSSEYNPFRSPAKMSFQSAEQME